MGNRPDKMKTVPTCDDPQSSHLFWPRASKPTLLSVDPCTLKTNNQDPKTKSTLRLNKPKHAHMHFQLHLNLLSFLFRLNLDFLCYRQRQHYCFLLSEFEELSCLLLQHVGVLQIVYAISAIVALYLKYFIFFPQSSSTFWKMYTILVHHRYMITDYEVNYYIYCFLTLILIACTWFFYFLIENADNSGCCAGAAGRTRTHNRIVTGIEKLVSCLKERRVTGEWLYINMVGVLGKVFYLLCVHVSITIQRDNQRCVSVCLKLLGVLCVFPGVWQHMPRVTAEQTRQW